MLTHYLPLRSWLQSVTLGHKCDRWQNHHFWGVSFCYSFILTVMEIYRGSLHERDRENSTLSCQRKEYSQLQECNSSCKPWCQWNKALLTYDNTFRWAGVFLFETTIITDVTSSWLSRVRKIVSVSQACVCMCVCVSACRILRGQRVRIQGTLKQGNTRPLECAAHSRKTRQSRAHILHWTHETWQNPYKVSPDIRTLETTFLLSQPAGFYKLVPSKSSKAE